MSEHSSRSSGVRRREFLKVVGAGAAAASATACQGYFLPEKTGKLIPYLVSPDQTVPGVSTYYATVCRECAAACGVIAETRDGRVIKLEGNPAHPLNRGALCARGQAAVQGLYNPDRFRTPLIRNGSAWRAATWDEAIKFLAQKVGELRSSGNAANALFLNQHESGSFPAFLDGWLAAYGMRPHLSVDFEADHAAAESNRRAYGFAVPRWNFATARLIISFGADFLDTWGASVPQQLDFADARAKGKDAPRFIYVGPRRSLTGLNADQWIACRPGSEVVIANFLSGRGDANATSQASDVPAATLQALAQEFAAAKPALVLASGHNGPELVTAAAALNGVRPMEGLPAFEGVVRTSDVMAAVERMRAGQVPAVFVRGVNPAYALPKSARFADAFAKVPLKVSFSMFPDETTELCDVILPDLHSLESWGDAESVRGTLSLQQPAMDPVFTGTRSTADVLIAVAKADATIAGRFADADYRTWLMKRLPGAANAATMADAYARGFTAGTVAPRAAASTALSAPVATTAAAAQSGDFFLVTYPSPTVGDGRGANKPWLQELPDPVTKVLWSSWVEIHPETAARLGIDRGDILEVKTATGTVRAPAIVYMGVRTDTVAIPLGQGHASSKADGWFDGKDTAVQWGYGRYARAIGINALDLLPGSLNASGAMTTVTRCAVSKTGDHVMVPSTEGSARQHGRGIAQAVPAAELGRAGRGARDEGGEPGERGENGEAGVGGEHGEGKRLPGDASHEFLPGLRSPTAADAQGELGSPTAADRGTQQGMYDPRNPLGMTRRRWAMTVDLARCTGCSACVTACYAENNIPTVGAPWQNGVVYANHVPGFNITRGREMNWLRLERYYEGGDDGRFTADFEARFVPMLCQHCGNAPCEPVCPVFATYHAPDGLNVQVYNRCVGTRYCSNNCPYKVRYFNWFGYGEPDRAQYAFPEPLNWQLNPDVTVRTKGVMEKCSFCVQRIREAEHRAALENRDVQPDEFTTACAAACPSRAITFGDAADANWSVTRFIEDERAYHVFEELNTYTAVVYLKKINHPTSAAPHAEPATAGTGGVR
ncbi:MAG TPA: 4Fe-4S dicluster domain-containing protein [Gemmatimonadaceae bacterium]|nr:4Fe-4S dicluster domain-containing protein [Gemmatimonadaceae bacterium]